MTNLTAWAGGNLNSSTPIAYQSAFGAELNVTGGIANGFSILSSVQFDNSLGLDQFMDISFVGALTGAQTIVAGAAVSFAMACLQGDNVTYGDGRVTGTPVSYQPLLNPLGAIQIQPASLTALIGDTGLVTLRPRKFSLILTNNTGFTIAATGNSCWISTYRQNMNN